jgi:ABC-type enterobactin transport system permease subunit
MAVALGIALVVTIVVAVKVPAAREKLVGVGLAIAGVLAACVAFLMAQADLKRVRRVAKAKIGIKDSVKESKERHEQEVKDVAAIQGEVDAVSEDSPSLDALADRMNGR